MPSVKILTQPIVILALFVIIAYLPALLPFFHVKNDLITQNLPTRFFISESIYSNTFPWWNPYINYGIPQYGDMNNGFWNPIIWFISCTFGYTVLSITLEEMLYIFIGGWGVFKLLKYLGVEEKIALIGSLSYMGGGFIVGHLQHLCWITGTAFFPYLLYYYLKSILVTHAKYFVKGGLFTFLFLSSTHPGLIIGTIYFFFFLVFYLLVKQGLKKAKDVILKTFLFLVCGSVLSLIVIYSNVDVLNEISRGNKVAFVEALNLPTTLQSYLSLLFPAAVNKGDFFDTDISMRNIYIGILPLAGIVFFIKKLSKVDAIFYWCILIFFICLSAGIGRHLFYNYLPYAGFVRLNGEFAYFVFLIFIVSGGLGLAGLDFNRSTQWKKTIRLLIVFFIITAITAFAKILLNNEVVTDESKTVFEKLGFWALLLIASILQLAFLILFNTKWGSKNFKLTYFLWSSTIVWCSLPFTGISKIPRSEVQSIINFKERGIVTPSQKSINTNNYIDSTKENIIGSAGFYSKQIGYVKTMPYPTELKTQSLYSVDPVLNEYIEQQPFLFLANDTIIGSKSDTDLNKLKIERFTPTHVTINVTNRQSKFLILLQNKYPRWQVYIDKKRVTDFVAFKTFIGIPISKGVYKVDYVFNVFDLKIILFLNIFLIIAALLYLITVSKLNRSSFIKSSSPS